MPSPPPSTSSHSPIGPPALPPSINFGPPFQACHPQSILGHPPCCHSPGHVLCACALGWLRAPFTTAAPVCRPTNCGRYVVGWLCDGGVAADAPAVHGRLFRGPALQNRWCGGAPALASSVNSLPCPLSKLCKTLPCPPPITLLESPQAHIATQPHSHTHLSHPNPYLPLSAQSSPLAQPQPPPRVPTRADWLCGLCSPLPPPVGLSSLLQHLRPPPEVLQLLSSLLCWDARDRPTAQAATQMPFFKHTTPSWPNSSPAQVGLVAGRGGGTGDVGWRCWALGADVGVGGWLLDQVGGCSMSVQMQASASEGPSTEAAELQIMLQEVELRPSSPFQQHLHPKQQQEGSGRVQKEDQGNKDGRGWGAVGEAGWESSEEESDSPSRIIRPGPSKARIWAGGQV